MIGLTKPAAYWPDKVKSAMKIRRLQRKDEHEQWYDDAYVYENEDGQVIFCCNLTWESVGRRYYKAFQESGVPIEDVETVLSLDGRTMRWLPLEVIADDQVALFLEKLDEACDIPGPRSVTMAEALKV